MISLGFEREAIWNTGAKDHTRRLHHEFVKQRLQMELCRSTKTPEEVYQIIWERGQICLELQGVRK